jgi:hypothetical protein
MAMLVSYVQSREEAVAAQGVRLLLATVDTLAPALDASGWAAIVEPVLALAAEDPLQQLAPVQSAGEQQQGPSMRCIPWLSQSAANDLVLLGRQWQYWQERLSFAMAWAAVHAIRWRQILDAACLLADSVGF